MMNAAHRLLLCIAMLAVAGLMRGATPFGRPDRSGPDSSWVIPGFTADSVKRALGARSVHPLEGIWSDPSTGTEIAVIQDAPLGTLGPGDGTLLIVALRTAMIGIHSGTVAGWMNPTARDNCYEARMFTAFSTAMLSDLRTFFIRLTDGSMVLTQEQKGFRVVLKNLLPFYLRRSLREVDNTPKDISGYVRIWPENPDHPKKVRLL